MKIIHSYWYNNNLSKRVDKNGGFNSIGLDYYCFLFSALLIKQKFGNIEFYGDKESCEYFKDLPYDKFNVIDIPKKIPSHYWFYSKIVAYEKMNEPFIHIDGDVFLFNENLLNNFINYNKYDLLLQSKEENHLYDNIYKPQIPLLKNAAPTIDWNLTKYAYNVGVFGCRNKQFLEKYISNLKNLMKLFDNSNEMNKINNLKSLFVEQLYLSVLAKKENINVDLIMKDSDIKKYGYFNVGNHIGYAHMIAGTKYVDFLIDKLKLKIKNMFPDYYHLVEAHDDKIDYQNLTFVKLKVSEIFNRDTII